MILAVLGALYFFINKLDNKSPNKVTPIESIQGFVEPSSTPDPFYDLTIPYLRGRSYQSSLGNLEKISENQNYYSYLTYYISDGLKINGLLTQPKGEQPQGGWPAVIFIHGYVPPKQYQTTEKYVEYVDFLARSGFVVFKIDLRGHGNSEGEPNGAYYSSDYVIDTLNAYSSLKTGNFVNPNKIGLWGHSMAGNVILRSLVAQPQIPAVVIWSGAGYTYTDIREYGISDTSYAPIAMSRNAGRRQLLSKLHGQVNPEDPFWKQVIPTNYLNDLKGAIQLNHAVNDEVVSVDYSRSLNKLLDQTKITHEFNEYPSGGHNISGVSFTESMQKTVNFFKENLN